MMTTHTWGRWTFDPAMVSLIHRDEEGDEYEVDLEECTTSAKTLDRICRVSKKTGRPTQMSRIS